MARTPHWPDEEVLSNPDDYTDDLRIEGPTWVYRLICDCGSLLYVGIAKDVQRRMRQHASSKPWWPDVTVILTDQYPTRFQAFKVESYYITYFRPLHNDSGKVALPVMPEPIIRQRSFVSHAGQLFDVETEQRAVFR